MNAPIIFVGGSKGGVGKSILAMTLLDYLSNDSRTPALIETDTSNPDVWKSYRNIVGNTTKNLDDAEGWIELVNLLAGEVESDTNITPTTPVVINSAARANDSVLKNGDILSGALSELGRELITVWVINRQRDSLELLRDYMDAMPTAKVHVIKNGYFGDDKKFELYNNSKIRKAVEDAGGKSLYFPDLADRVSDELYTKRLTIADALGELPLGSKAELQRWRAAAHEVAKEILG